MLKMAQRPGKRTNGGNIKKREYGIPGGGHRSSNPGGIRR